MGPFTQKKIFADATRPDLLGRVAMMNLPDTQVEDLAKLPRGALCRMRKGGFKTGAVIDRLEAFLDGKTGTAEPKATAQERLPNKGGKTSTSSLSPLGQALLKGIDSANSYDELASLSKLNMRATLLGEIGNSMSKVIQNEIKEHRLLLEKQLAERAEGQKDKPVEVVVRFENDWRGAPACEHCAGTGFKP